MDDDDDLGPSGTLVIEPERRSDLPDRTSPKRDDERLVPVPIAPRYPSERPLPAPPIFQLVKRGVPRPGSDLATAPTHRIDSPLDDSRPESPSLEPHELDWGEEPRTQVKPEEEEVPTLLKEPQPYALDMQRPSQTHAESQRPPSRRPPSQRPASQRPPSERAPSPPPPTPDNEGARGYDAPPVGTRLEALLHGGPTHGSGGLTPGAGYPHPMEPASPPSRGWLLLAFGGALGLVFSIAAVVLALRQKPDPIPTPSAIASASASPTPLPEDSAPPPPVSVAPLPSAAPTSTASASASVPTLPEADRRAVAALEKLRDGIDACVKDTIHVLPGASKPVPDAMAWFKHGPYASLKRDWASPFYSCTHFRVDEPMPFMIQWQVDQPNVRGTGVAWVPDDKGFVARVYGFSAKLVGKKLELGPVGPLPVTRKIQRK